LHEKSSQYFNASLNKPKEGDFKSRYTRKQAVIALTGYKKAKNMKKMDPTLNFNHH